MLLVSSFSPLPAFGHTGAEHHRSPGPGGPESASSSAGEVYLQERLGAKIPLDLSFRDEKGETVRLADLVTGPTIILPVYYGCSNVCNYLQGGLARVLPELKPRPVADYRILSISIDERETPQLAARYQRMYLNSLNGSFPSSGWRFLTGDAPSIHRLTDAAGYHFQRRGQEMVHPVASLVVASDGTIVRYLYGTTFLPKDVTLALVEARQGRVGGAIRQVVGYCFSFDPATRSYQFNLLRVSATVIILCCGAFLAYLLLAGGTNNRKRSGES